MYMIKKMQQQSEEELSERGGINMPSAASFEIFVLITAWVFMRMRKIETNEGHRWDCE